MRRFSLSQHLPLTGLLLCAGLLLSGCVAAGGGIGWSFPRQPRSPLTIPKYADTKPVPQYGSWWIRTESCTLHATSSDFELATDGHLEKQGTLYLSLRFATPLSTPPIAELSHLPVPVPVEGQRGTYNVILAYDSTTAAHMLDPGTYLIIRYQPTRSAQVLESSFATRDLLYALGDLNRNCH